MKSCAKSQKEYLRDEEGRIIINMNVKNDDNFLSPFSSSETPVISSEVADFIEKSSKGTLPGESYTLRIKSSCIDDEEKLLYKKAIFQYYDEELTAKSREIRKNRLIALILGILGIAVLAIALIIDYNLSSPIWSEVIDIVAWVLVWESVYLELFSNRQDKIKIKYYQAYKDMKIEYE